VGIGNLFSPTDRWIEAKSINETILEIPKSQIPASFKPDPHVGAIDESAGGDVVGKIDENDAV
jgi:hypothetical protein